MTPLCSNVVHLTDPSLFSASHHLNYSQKRRLSH
jgi:hypothetical protein